MPSASFYSSPFGRRLGDLLQSQLDSGDWTSLSGAIAWVRSSGVRHLSESLRRFAVAGGTARIAIGIDFGGSTAEGLSLLNEAVGPSGEIWIVHHDNPRTTFHPKAVLLENRKTAVAFIGSGNLTEGGLFSNFELGTELMFDLGISGDADARASLRMELDRYLRPSKISRRLAPKLLERLVEDGTVVSERVATERLAKATRPRSTSRETSMFGTLRIPEPPRPQSISIATKGIDGAGVPRKTVKANRHSKAHRNVMKQELKKKRDRRPNTEFMRPVQPDAMLARVVGSSPLSRMELTKKLWAYIKRNVLQDKKNRRLINADDNFKRIFGGRAQVDMFQMTALVATHIK